MHAGRHVVLTVEDIPNDMLIKGAMLSNDERADLNRGRAYLQSIAAKQGVRVASNVQEGLEMVVATLKQAKASANEQKVD